MTIPELRELLQVLRDNGVTCFRDGELSVVLGAIPGVAMTVTNASAYPAPTYQPSAQDLEEDRLARANDPGRAVQEWSEELERVALHSAGG